MSQATMWAIQVHEYGAPDVLRLEQIPRLEPGPDDVLVRVHAAGVLPMETAVRQGLFTSFMKGALPYTPGTAFAGVVEAAGANVTAFKVGDAICGRGPNGTYAEYTVVNTNPPPITPEIELSRYSSLIIPLAHKPESISFDEAAALSGGATTAWTSVIEDGQLQPGQRALIHGAAGGVGLFAVQFARWKGAPVIATASAANLDFVRSLGAEVVIDYRSTAFEDVVHDVDFVLDTMGGDVMLRSMRVVKPGGTLISVYGDPPADLAAQLGIRASHNIAIPNSNHLRQIVELIDGGHAKPYLRQIFPLCDAPLAHALSESGHGRGRIVLHIAD